MSSFDITMGIDSITDSDIEPYKSINKLKKGDKVKIHVEYVSDSNGGASFSQNIISFNKIETENSANAKESIKDKNWKMINLLGKPIDQTSGEYFISFNSKGKNMAAKVGCNLISSGYDLKNDNKIKIYPVFSTDMMCPNISLEDSFNEKIQKVDNYKIIGNRLQLNVGMYVTSAQKEGVGATRHCDFTMMDASAEEKITQWNEGKNIKIEVTELKKMPGIKTTALDLAIQNSGEKPILSSTMEYSMKNVFFDMMNTVMMKNMNAKFLDGIMAGHKLYIETGTVVNEKTKLDLSQVKRINE